MRLYASGPMTGKPNSNFDAFRWLTHCLRVLGHEVFSPAEMDEAEGYTPAADGSIDAALYARFLIRDLQLIVDEGVEGVVVLPDWETSAGAKTEIAFAKALRLPVFTLVDDDLYEIAPISVSWNVDEYPPTEDTRWLAAGPSART